MANSMSKSKCRSLDGAFRSMLAAWAVLALSVALFSGCTTKPRLVLLEEFEAAPAILDTLDTELSLVPGCEIRLADADSLPPSAAAFVDSSGGDALPPVFAVLPSLDTEAVITCNFQYRIGYSGGHWNPGFTTSSGTTVPGYYSSGYSYSGWSHFDSRTIPLESVHDLDRYLLCRVSPWVGSGASFLSRRTVYVRKPGMEILIGDRETPDHPGYLHLEGGSWILVEKRWVEHFEVESRTVVEKATSEEDPGEPNDQEVEDSEPFTCTNLDNLLAESPDYPEAVRDFLRATCLAAAGEDEEALALMRAATGEAQEEETLDGFVRWFHWQELLIQLAAGHIEEAVPTGAAYLQRSGASEEFPEVFAYLAPVDPSPQAEFLANRRVDIERHWTDFRKAFAAALDKARRESESARLEAAREVEEADSPPPWED